MQIASPIRELVPADHAMPLGPRLVLAVAVRFPADATREREASLLIALRRGVSLGVLADEPDESDAIFAVHFFVRSCPDRLGRPGANGAALKPSEASFSEDPNQIVL